MLTEGWEFLFLLLPIAAASGWWIGRHQARGAQDHAHQSLPKNYVVGLNFLLNEQPDKAVDIFIKMLDVDSETIETHLALGHLFRRRGEVDRAIRIHQNLMARPGMDKPYRVQALLALGQDYFKAGLLDRAEGLFLQVIELDEHETTALAHLLDIYQQQKNWHAALQIAERYRAMPAATLAIYRGHYHCELAIEAHTKNNVELARRHLKQAFQSDPSSVRASLLQATLESSTAHYAAAISSYQQVFTQDPSFLSETLLPLRHCYQQLEDKTGFTTYLQNCLAKSGAPSIAAILLLTDEIKTQQGSPAATTFLTTQLQRHPELYGLIHFIELQIEQTSEPTHTILTTLRDLIRHLLNGRSLYRCHICGFNGKVLHWHCPGCKQWNTVRPLQ